MLQGCSHHLKQTSNVHQVSRGTLANNFPVLLRQFIKQASAFQQ